MINIYDIAKKAGVSIATVSRVVNGSSKVSDKTKQKVLDVMREYEYTPNIFARGLSSDSMKTVGILCPDISDAYMSRSVSYLEQELHAHGFDCILGCSGFLQEDKESYVKLLLSKRIDLLILVGSTYAGAGRNPYETDYIREAAKQTPVFLINGYVEGENIYCTCAGDYKIVYDSTMQLIRAGHKNLIFLYDSNSFSAKEKMRGYETALIDSGLPNLGERKIFTKNDIEYTKHLLLSYKELSFDGVIASEDAIAIGVIKYAKMKQISIPAELSIIGYNDSTLARSCEPELSSVDSKIDVMCKSTVERMMALKAGETIAKRKDISCELVKRCTTDF